MYHRVCFAIISVFSMYTSRMYVMYNSEHVLIIFIFYINYIHPMINHKYHTVLFSTLYADTYVYWFSHCIRNSNHHLSPLMQREGNCQLKQYVLFFWLRSYWNCVYVSWDFYIASLSLIHSCIIGTERRYDGMGSCVPWWFTLRFRGTNSALLSDNQ